MPTTLNPNHDVCQAYEIIVYYNNTLGNSIIPIDILLSVLLTYKCLLCMCGKYVQRTSKYFYISNLNPLIIETNNSNSNLLRECQPNTLLSNQVFESKI